MRVAARGAGGGDDAVVEIEVRDGSLECLLGTHGRTDDRAKVRDVKIFGEQKLDGPDVIPDDGDRDPGPWKGSEMLEGEEELPFPKSSVEMRKSLSGFRTRSGCSCVRRSHSDPDYLAV